MRMRKGCRPGMSHAEAQVLGRVVLGHRWLNLVSVEDCRLVVRDEEKAVAPHSSSTLAWKIPWAEEPGGLQSTGSRRVGQD